MFVIGSHIGFVLVFDDVDDIVKVIGHLGGMLQHAKDHDVPGPHLYGVFSEGVDQEAVEEFLASLKDGDHIADLIIIQEDRERTDEQ